MGGLSVKKKEEVAYRKRLPGTVPVVSARQCDFMCPCRTGNG